MDFGNCDEFGRVDVILDGKTIATASGENLSEIVMFDFKDGSKLIIQENGDYGGIIRINRFNVTKCCSNRWDSDWDCIDWDLID